MWPFSKKQVEVTSEEFAKSVMGLMGRGAKDFCADLQKQAEESWTFEQDEAADLGTEVFIAHLWAASKVFGPHKRVLDLLHDGYYAGCYRSGKTEEENVARATTAQSNLFARYQKYYKAWDDDMNSEGKGLALAFEMSQFFFPKRRPVLSAFLQATIKVYFVTFMVTALEFGKKYHIADT